MDASASSSPSTPGASDPSQKIQHLPEAAQAAFRRFKIDGDPAALDVLIFAFLDYYKPRKQDPSLADSRGDALLIEDLGFDSLAITEVVFFTEDVFDISIANEEILQVRTLDDLRSFIRQKVAARKAA